jgi:Ca2+-binding RTX toxin-like protein
MLGSGDATVFGAAGDTISAGASALAFIDATLGDTSVVLGSSGSDTIFSGSGDTITGAAGGTATATIVGAAGDTINLSGWDGTANINANQGNEAVTVGGGASTVFGAAGDTISLGTSFDAFVDAHLGGMSVQIGSSGSDTIFALSNSNDTASGAGHDTITAVSGSSASANVILADGDKVDLTAGMGNATINALAGSDTVTLGGGATTVFAAQADTVTGGAGASTVNLGSGAVNISLPGGHGAATVGDVGVTGADTVTGFNNAQDSIFFSGENTNSIDKLVATQSHPSGDSTQLTFPDGTTMTLIGISHVDNAFFK